MRLVLFLCAFMAKGSCWFFCVSFQSFSFVNLIRKWQLIRMEVERRKYDCGNILLRSLQQRDIAVEALSHYYSKSVHYCSIFKLFPVTLFCFQILNDYFKFFILTSNQIISTSINQRNETTSTESVCSFVNLRKSSNLALTVFSSIKIGSL